MAEEWCHNHFLPWAQVHVIQRDGLPHWGLMSSLLCWRNSTAMRRGEKNGARLLTSPSYWSMMIIWNQKCRQSPHHLFSSFTCGNIILQFGMHFLLYKNQKFVILIWYHNSKVLQEAVKTCFLRENFSLSIICSSMK